MKVEVLYFKACPNYEATLRLVHRLACDLGPGVKVEEVEVTSSEDVARLRVTPPEESMMNSRPRKPIAARRSRKEPR